LDIFELFFFLRAHYVFFGIAGRLARPARWGSLFLCFPIHPVVARGGKPPRE
jgi:hypothetical protein